MAYVLMPKRVAMPWMHSDHNPYYGLDWTPQPGRDGILHTRVTGPAGIVPLEHKAPPEAAIPDIPSSLIWGTSTIRLRDYQEEAVQSVFKAWKRGVKAPLVVMPTGVGKTIVAAKLMELGSLLMNRRSLFVAHRKELIDQTAEKILLVTNSMATVGTVQASRNELNATMTVGSIQTLGHKSLKRIGQFLDHGEAPGILIVDEAHHAVSAQWLRVINAFKEANPDLYVVGLTATPGRADGTALDTVFSEVVFERNLFDMVQAGWLVPPKGFKVTLAVDLDRVATKQGDYVRSQLSKLMNTPHVNGAVVRAWQEYGHNRKTLAFAVDVAHATALAAEFSDAGYAAEFVDGTMKERERAGRLKRFREGETKVLVNVEIATEGYDDPSIEAILFARPTQSQSLHIQGIGRGLRPFPGKTECLIIDCVGNTEKHQLVQLASLAGFDPNERVGKARRSGDEEGFSHDEDEEPEVIGANIHGEEVELAKRPRQAKYQWRETSLGWVLQIPRIGYFLVAWSTLKRAKCAVRFYDQRPGRKNDPPREVVGQPIDFEMAYGLVESELDRIFLARGARSVARNQRGGMYEHGDDKEFSKKDDQADGLAMSFVDLDEGLEEDLYIQEELMLKDAAWRSRPMTSSQKDLLLKLGAKEKSLPAECGEASDLITILQIERDAKMRLPPTVKQIGYLKVHGLPMAKTKGEAARYIWQHRKGVNQQ
jgi:superfamily II DNA or RNA helicase